VPVFLYGLSAGGMLCMQIAGKLKVEGRTAPKGIIPMCFIDVREQAVLDMGARNLFCSRVGVPSAPLAVALGLGWLSFPFKWVAKMTTLVNDPKCLRVCLQDTTSAGAAVSMQFLADYYTYKPALDWEEFDACPILLTFPMEDRWVTLDQSKECLAKARKAEWEVVEMENAGHYPLEDPGLQQMADGIIRFVNARL
jgi:alpha-beta hydrolase superfamily lysophospholipase